MLPAVYMAVPPLRRKHSKKALPRPAGQILTLAAVCFAWLFFRAGSLPRAGELLARLFSPRDPAAGLQLLLSAPAHPVSPAVLAALLPILLLVVRRLPSLSYGKSTETSDIVWVALVIATVLAALIRMDGGGVNAFIYFQF